MRSIVRRSGAASALDAEFAGTRHKLVDQVWRTAGWLAVFEFPLIAWRVADVGWHVQLMLHVAFSAITVTVALLRKRLAHELKSRWLVLAALAVGVSGVLSLGMVGAGLLWIALSVGLASVLYSLRVGVVVATVAAAMMVAAGIGFVGGRLTLPFDLNAHAVSASGWFDYLAVTIVALLVLLYAIGGFQEAVLALLAKLHAQRDQLVVQRDQLAILASHDPLTGLPTMQLATDRLQMAINGAGRSGSKIAMLFIDLDGFKAVNDACGHEAGDEVLKQVARRLQGAVRADDTVARAGGDEFIVVLVGLLDADAVRPVASKLIAEVSRPFELAGGTATVGASIGIAMYPDHADETAGLRRLADAAMYHAKRSGKNRFVFAQPETPPAVAPTAD
ncbi:MAG: GGDEF domain-containing protein [Burkholderiales bacterium]|nr:GGDEF domain-containing protein [Burkholderiales bacterium]